MWRGGGCWSSLDRSQGYSYSLIMKRQPTHLLHIPENYPASNFNMAHGRRPQFPDVELGLLNPAPNTVLKVMAPIKYLYDLKILK